MDVGKEIHRRLAEAFDGRQSIYRPIRGDGFFYNYKLPYQFVLHVHRGKSKITIRYIRVYSKRGGTGKKIVVVIQNITKELGYTLVAESIFSETKPFWLGCGFKKGKAGDYYWRP